MSRNLLRICSILLEDSFGVTVKRVAETLILIGPVRLPGIASHSGVSQPEVKEALKILFLHNLLTFKRNEGFAEPFYQLNEEGVLSIPRFPQFLATAEKSLGVDCRIIVDEVTRAGQVTISKLFYVLGYKFTKENPKSDGNALYERLVVLRAAVRKTAERKYICPCQSITSDASNPVPVFDSSPELETFIVPKVDLRIICDKIAKKETNLEEFEDTSIYWRVNVDRFHAEFKNELLIEALQIRCNFGVDPTTFRALLELGTKDQQFPAVSSSVSVVDIHAYLTKAQKPPPTIERVREQFEIIDEDTLDMITKVSSTNHGSYAVNLKNAFNYLTWATIERTILEKYGFCAARIFRIIKKLKYVEQDKINDIGMIAGKYSKQLTYLLIENNFVTLKEIRKTYTATASANKASLVFCVDINQIVHTLVESCYKAMINCRLRIRVEKERNSRLVDKEDRIDRILANMISNDCSEEQLKEVRDMITPPERTLISRYKEQIHKLMSGHLHVDHTLFILQIYLLYAGLK